MIEPIAQVFWSPNNIKRVPNEDSPLTEFDEGNLFDLALPGASGLRANLGTGLDPDGRSGWSLGMTAGRVIRAGRNPVPRRLRPFGQESDWLLGTTLTANGFTVANRALFDDRFGFSREDGYLDDDYQVALGYLWMRADRDRGPPRAHQRACCRGRWARRGAARSPATISAIAGAAAINGNTSPSGLSVDLLQSVHVLSDPGNEQVSAYGWLRRRRHGVVPTAGLSALSPGLGRGARNEERRR